MKRNLFLITLFTAFTLTALNPVQAGIIDKTKDKIAQNQAVRAQKNEIKQAEKEIRATFKKQLELSNRNDIEGLKAFYAENYRNTDGFKKDVTFKIISDNYKIYPELKSDLIVKNIDVRGNYAIADVYETANMEGLVRDDVEMDGYLEAFAHTVYYLEKINGKWLVTSEHTVEESNAITFGEARYLDFKLVAPPEIPAGSVYNSTLTVNNIPRQALIMGSISKTRAEYPLKDTDDDSYRVLEDTVLERIFTANKDNVNEYVVSTIGITRAQPVINGNLKIYMSGLAFLMTRVNVIPENNFAEIIEADNEETAENND